MIYNFSSTIKLVMFDLDGTLAVSKSPLDPEMASLLCALMSKVKVAIISGASFAQFKVEVLDQLTCGQEQLSNLFIFPAQGGSLYEYDTSGKWNMVYEHNFTPEEVMKIRGALDFAIAEAMKRGINFPEQVYGERIEDRGSQVTFSAVGQQAPVDVKKTWDPDHAKRDVIQSILVPLLPDCAVAIGGMTSIDITRKGIDKEFGINRAVEYIEVAKDDIVYVGDSLFEGGNDYPAVRASVHIHPVKDVAETKEFIKAFL